MAVEFSIPWIRSQLHSAQSPGVISDSSSVISGLSNSEDIPKTNKSFVLFVRLPDWKSSNGVSEICTLRRLRNNIELYKIKQLLELSAGIPAHVQSLFTFDDKIVSDDTSLTMKIKQPWENVVRSVWKENLKEVTNHLHIYISKQKQNKSDSVTPQERELASLALLVASSQGNLPICKVLLLNDVDPSYSTVFGNSCLHCAAFKGHLDILQILVAYGANVRARNILGKSSMDIAISAGFVECAKWLWLHQWSISIIRSGNDISTEHTKGTKHKSTPNGFLSKLPPSNLNKLSKQQSKPNSFTNSVDPLKNKRPKTASPLRLSASPKFPRPKSAMINDHKHPTLPKFYPEMTAFLKREQSIPSKYECRYREQSDVGVLGKPHHLHDFDKPVRKPERSFIIDSPPKSAKPNRPVKQEPSKIVNNIPNSREVFQLHGQSSEKVEDVHLPPKSPTVLPEKKSEIKSANKGNDIIEAFLNNHKKLPETPSIRKTDVKVKSEQPNSAVLTDTLPLKNVNHSMLSRPTSLWENTTTVKTKERPRHSGVQPNSMKRQTVKNSTLKDDKIKEEELLKRQEEQHRKSEEAYQKWLETKQREKIAKRKSEILESAGDSKYYTQASPTTPKMWGISFDEWLESKKKTSTHIQESNEDNKKVARKLTRGKTFDEWTKEKKQEAVRNQRSQSEPNIEDDEKLAEMRERKFELWKKRKMESARTERRNTEVVEQQKLVEMQQDYVQWKSKPRVMSFDEWREKKKNDRRLSEMDNAQTAAVKFVEEWAHKDREKKAAWAFNRWLLRKESIQLQAVQKEFKLAKEKRQRVEQKIQLRREQREKRRQLLMAKNSNPYTDDDFTSDNSDYETNQPNRNSQSSDAKESAVNGQVTVSFEAQPTVLDGTEYIDQKSAKSPLFNLENESQLKADNSIEKEDKNLHRIIKEAVVIKQIDNIASEIIKPDVTTDGPSTETTDSVDKTNPEKQVLEIQANPEKNLDINKNIENKKEENVNKIPSTPSPNLTDDKPILSGDKMDLVDMPKENKVTDQKTLLGGVVIDQTQQNSQLISVNISKTNSVAGKKVKVRKKKFKAKKIISSANKSVH